jgi:serine/threonine protein kinase
VGDDLPDRAGDSSLQLTAHYQVGSRVGGYELEEQIGLGGMAVVFRARDARLGRPVALKILAPALAADEAFRHRFIRESRMAAAVDDPHIIPVYEAGEADGALFIAMRYVRGGDVRSLLYREGALSPARVAAIISPVASALDTAHAAGLVHRDVKPANMLLDARPGRPDHVYLSDFGLSKEALGATGLTSANQFLGTVDYAAPEQVFGQVVSGSADQYALGCAAFEMFSGEPPFRRDQAMAVLYAHMSEQPPPISSRRAGLPAALDPVFARVLAKSPANRYPSCMAFTEALRQAAGLAPYDAPDRPNRPATEVARPAGPTPLPTEAATPTPWAASQSPPPGQHAPSGQPYIPGLYPGQSGPAAAPRRERRWPLIALSAVGTAAVVAIAYSLVVLASRNSANTALTGGSPTATAGTTPPASSPPVTSPPVTPTPSGFSPSVQNPVQGSALYTDQEGFSFRLPPGWAYSSATRTGTDYPEVHFTGPPTGFDLEISWSRITGPSALGSWKELNGDSIKNGDPGYQLIALHQVSYRGYDAAVWEFTDIRDGVLTHVIDWGFVVKPGVLGFAIALKGPESDWQPVYSSIWEPILNSFRPPG